MVNLLLLVSLVFSQIANSFYTPTDNGSSVKFQIKNLGVQVGGSLTGLQGKIVFDPANATLASFDATVDVGTINTGIEMRDDHLRSEDYFDAKNYPKIRFVSTKVSTGKSGSFLVTGNLTIKDVTKEISFPFKASPLNEGFQFTGEFKINRRDFKVGGKSITMSDNLTVKLDVYAPKG